jgi:hypothetical protein
MSIVIQLRRTLTERILEDLRRPHGHAAERVGFLFGRLTSGDTDMVVMTRYVPVPDEQYVVDDTVGARINGDAIRAAMQGVLDTGDGVFHTHLHEWPGRPAFSRTDSTELPSTTAQRILTFYAKASSGTRSIIRFLPRPSRGDRSWMSSNFWH